MKKATGSNSHVIPGDLVYTVDVWSTLWLACPNDISYIDMYGDVREHESLPMYTPCIVVSVITERSFGHNLFFVITQKGFGWLHHSDVAPFFTAKEPGV